MKLCAAMPGCGGVTEEDGKFEVRAGNVAVAAPPGHGHSDTSWVITNLGACRGGSVAAGLVLGAPEHDWSRTKNLAFYNNNAWLATGMQRLGAFLAARPEGPPRPASSAAEDEEAHARSKSRSTLSAQLLGNATQLAASLQASLRASAVVDAGGSLVFVPPYAEKNATPYASMTANREASCVSCIRARIRREAPPTPGDPDGTKPRAS